MSVESYWLRSFDPPGLSLLMRLLLMVLKPVWACNQQQQPLVIISSFASWDSLFTAHRLAVHCLSPIVTKYVDASFTVTKLCVTAQESPVSVGCSTKLHKMIFWDTRYRAISQFLQQEHPNHWSLHTLQRVIQQRFHTIFTASLSAPCWSLSILWLGNESRLSSKSSAFMFRIVPGSWPMFMFLTLLKWLPVHCWTADIDR